MSMADDIIEAWVDILRNQASILQRETGEDYNSIIDRLVRGFMETKQENPLYLVEAGKRAKRLGYTPIYFKGAVK